ncbi:CoA-binding protein [Clostridium sp.]|uniref:CoA-binding protein n=1 Tax=Clostridium sp. TaxID=1506 RepID=UPI0026314CFF|nr:CoA-binding protein [Clostridium sp.]
MDIKEMIKLKNWVVIGDIVTEGKYANKILNRFNDKGYRVCGVSHKTGENVYDSLSKVPYKIEAIDLCVNPRYGINYLKEALTLGIKSILIQPGAESEEILKFCKENNIDAIENCALVQLANVK